MAKRRKKRYILLASEPQKNPDHIAKAVLTSYKKLFGIFGLASADLRVIRNYPDKGMTILRCALDHVPRLLLAAAFVKRIDSEPVALRVITISGTVKKIKEKMRGLQS